MDLTKVLIYRITHIENIPHIIQNGITHKDSNNANQHYKSIGDSSIISSRDNLEILNGKLLGDYIPFYLGPRTPMLYVIKYGLNGVPALSSDNIVYCVSSISKILDSTIPFLYTDGHANNNFTKFYTPDELINIETHVDFKATKAKYWIKDNDLDFKRRKEAELLVEKDVPYNLLLGFVTYDESSKNRISKLGVNTKKIIVKPSYYF